MSGLIGFCQDVKPEIITQTIRGVVTDKINRMPVAGATVIILNSNPLKGTATDNDGKFRLEKIPIGRVEIKISCLGYVDVTFPEIFLMSGKELVLNIELVDKVIVSKEVVISAKQDKSEALNKMATTSARCFTVEESMRYAGSNNDVARMAANFAGVNSTEGRNDIIIRGNSPSGLLWRLEGVDIPNPNHWAAFGTTGGAVSMLNNNLLANSDFMTGAFPAEYGNALSGVFDLKLRNGNNEKHEFLAQIGFNGFEGNAEGPISKNNGSSYLISYRISTYEVMTSLGMNLGTGTGIPKYQDADFKFNFPKTPIGSISLFGMGGKSWIDMWDSKRDTTKKETQVYYNSGQAIDLSNGSKTGVIGLNHIYIIDNSAYTRLILAVSYHDNQTLIDSVTEHTLAKVPTYRSKDSELRYSGTFIFNKKLNSHHNFKMGVNFSYSKLGLVDSVLEYSKFVTLTDFKGSANTLQPYLEWQYKITDNLILNTGINYLQFLYNNTYSIEPRVGLKWNFAPTQSLSLGYGKHSQINPIIIYFTQVPNSDSTYYIRTNKNLDLTRSHHLVLGYDWIISKNMRFKSEVYYQYIYNAAIYGGLSAENGSFSILNQGANFGVGAPDTLVNKGTGKNYGIELTLERYLSKGFYFLITGSLFDSKYTGGDGVERNTAFNGRYETNVLCGKEFVLNDKKVKAGKKQQLIVIDIRYTRCGGQRYTPLLVNESIQEGHAVYDETQAFSKQFPDYSKADLNIMYKINSKRITQEFGIYFTNILNQKNILLQTFNNKTGEVKNTYQIGFSFIPLWRMTF